EDRIAHSIVSRKRIVRRVPSPAFHFPRPPEPSRMWKSSRSTGKRSSRISGSVRRELVMWVDAAGAVEAASVIHAPCWGAGADGLVILILVIAEGEVVHRALRVGKRAHGGKQGVRHMLR